MGDAGVHDAKLTASKNKGKGEEITLRPAGTNSGILIGGQLEEAYLETRN